MIVVGLLCPDLQLACEDFLEDKVEELVLTGYPSEHFQFDGNYTGGKIVKGGEFGCIAFYCCIT